MTRSTIASLLFSVFGMILLTSGSATAQTSYDNEWDCAALMEQAREHLSLDSEDVVFLLDESRQTWLPDGRLQQHIHRIIRISSEYGVDHYGDHRVPYDHGHCEFTVHALRTYRDGQWWESGPSAKVVTLPRAVSRAPDYTNVREMMLLHDGIELPCILEVAYTITDRASYRAGADGLWLFQRPHPSVISRLVLEVPQGMSHSVGCSEPNLAADKKVDAQRGLDVYTWEMENLDARLRPYTSDPAAYIPHVEWSTWKDWTELGDYLVGQVRHGADSGQALKAVVDSLVDHAAGRFAQAQAAADFVSERTRYVDYPDHYWWPSPRSAERVYTTGYGHRLDRAILATALLEMAGFHVKPAFVGEGYGVIDVAVPTRARMAGVSLLVTDDAHDFIAYFDPQTTTFSPGDNCVTGRSVWLPGSGSGPELVAAPDKAEDNSLRLQLDLAYDADKGTFKGSGLVTGLGVLSPYALMVGTDGQCKKSVSALVSGVLAGAKVTDVSLTRFSPDIVEAGCSFEVKPSEPDDLGPVKLTIGDPGGGLLAALPGDAVLWRSERQSPVQFAGPLCQRIELRLDTSDVEIIYSPDSFDLSNGAGSCSVDVVARETEIRVQRLTAIAGSVYDSAAWPALRDILLAEANERHRTLLLKLPEGGGASENNKD